MMRSERFVRSCNVKTPTFPDAASSSKRPQSSARHLAAGAAVKTSLTVVGSPMAHLAGLGLAAGALGADMWPNRAHGFNPRVLGLASLDLLQGRERHAALLSQRDQVRPCQQRQALSDLLRGWDV